MSARVSKGTATVEDERLATNVPGVSCPHRQDWEDADAQLDIKDPQARKKGLHWQCTLRLVVCVPSQEAAPSDVCNQEGGELRVPRNLTLFG